MLKESIEIIKLTPDNIEFHSEDVAGIYKAGYFYNESTGRGFYPHDFVYSKKGIESAINSYPDSIYWDYIKKDGKPLCAIMNYLENNELEMMALVNTPEMRNQGNYLIFMCNYLNESVLGFLNNPKIHRILAEPQIVSPSVSAHLIGANALPVGYAPFMRNVKNPAFPQINSVDLGVYILDRDSYCRKDKITSIDERIPRSGNFSLSKVAPLCELISSFAGINAPIIKNPERIKSNKVNVEVLPEENIESLFMQKKQVFKIDENDYAFAFSHINDNSAYFDFSQCSNHGFESILKSMINEHKSKRMVFTKMEQSEEKLYQQKILIEKGFYPISFIPGGSGNGKDSVTFVKNKSSLKERIISKKIIQRHDYKLRNIYETKVLEGFDGYDGGNFINRLEQHKRIRNLVLK